MTDDPAALAVRAAEKMEIALDADENEAALPDPLGGRLRAAVQILRESADAAATDEERAAMLRTALAHLHFPRGIFVPHDLTLAGEAARLLTDRAIRASPLS
jgi:hypothetical protein